MAAADSPVVLVDLSVNPGRSCPADSSMVLESLSREGVRGAVLTIRDPNAVRDGMEAGIGATIEIEAGAATT